MAKVALATAFRQARTLAIGQKQGKKSDGEMLHAFADGDRDTFAALVKRHGPLVKCIRRWNANEW